MAGGLFTSGRGVDPRAAREGVAHLRAVDPTLWALIDRVGPYRLEADRGPDHFAALCESIVYQQLNGKAAAVIHRRFVDRLGGPPDPTRVAAASDADLRGVGLSGAKTRALKDLALAATDGRLPLPVDPAAPDEAIAEQLVRVRGIGPWTADMFLLFHLGRADVWPVGDFAIRTAAKRLYGLRGDPTPARLHRLAAPWRPWRSVASWYLWRSLDTPGRA